MTDKIKGSSVKCVRDARAYPPDCFSLPTDGRKAKYMREKRRALFIQYATYADADGTRARPGKKRICSELGVSMRTLDRLHADLKTLGCISDAIGLDGKIKLHGPRGTKERAVKPEVLPLPGSSPWFEGPDGKKHRIKLTNENIGPLSAEIRKLLLGEAQSAGAPDTKAGAPHSDALDVAGAPNSISGAPNSEAGAPNSKAGAPLSRVFGAQPPPEPTPTATTTATNPSTPGAAAGVSHSGHSLASRIISYIAGKLERTSLPSTQQQRMELEGLASSAPQDILTAATEAWCRERDITGLKFPLGKYLEEMPDYIRAAVAAANAPPPGELPPMTLEEAARERAKFLADNGYTEEEFTKLEQDSKYETNGEAIMRELRLEEQGQEP